MRLGAQGTDSGKAEGRQKGSAGGGRQGVRAAGGDDLGSGAPVKLITVAAEEMETGKEAFSKVENKQPMKNR